MSSIIKLVKNENDTISITNVKWDEYRDIMLAIEATIGLLRKELPDSFYYNQEGHKLLQKMECLYLNLQENGIPYRGLAESLDEGIIKKYLGNN